jgi:hypothetical protein
MSSGTAVCAKFFLLCKPARLERVCWYFSRIGREFFMGVCAFSSSRARANKPYFIDVFAMSAINVRCRAMRKSKRVAACGAHVDARVCVSNTRAKYTFR